MNTFDSIKLPASFFSDLHASVDFPERMELLTKFLKSPQVFQSKQIFLLGDIFELMIGPHQEYFHHYKLYFDLLAVHLKRGASIYYFQGNHDFHLKKLYEKFIHRYDVPNNFFLFDGPQLFTFQQKTIYLSHGDELDIHNIPYQRYKRWVRSNLARLVVERLVNEKMLRSIGALFAKKSKDAQKNFNWDLSMNQYRGFVQKLWEEGIQGIILGHSHICDAWEEGVHFYYNVGYSPAEKQFLFWGNEGHLFVPLE